MRFIYIANARIPTEKAHGLAIVKMCEAFAHAGAKVELVVPRRFNGIKNDPFEYYGVERNFRITMLPTVDLTALGKIGHWAQSLVFAEFAFWYCLFKKADVFYGRDELSLSHLSICKRNVVWEAHTAKKGLVIRMLLQKCKKLVVISRGLKDYYMGLGVPEEKILVAHSGVDLERFESIKEPKKELRKRLGLPLDKKIVAYVGKEKTMGKRKGVEELKEAFESVKKERLDARLVIMTEVFPKDVPLYMKAVDVLVMNYPAEEHYAKYMSPLKMFEYMASGTPIVTGDLPSIREVLSENSALFVRPHAPESLARGIVKILEDEPRARTIAGEALKNVEDYTWTERANSVLEHIA